MMGNNSSEPKGLSLPVVNVSWNDAQLYLKKLSQKTGKNYRLPSEAEFEYAARAGTTTRFFWGNDVNQADDYAWYSDDSIDSRYMQPVGLKKPNQFGLFDIVGKVWQWTQDCNSQNYIGAPTDGSAWMIGECSSRMIRGSNRNALQFLSPATRGSEGTTNQNYTISFRVARDL